MVITVNEGDLNRKNYWFFALFRYKSAMYLFVVKYVKKGSSKLNSIPSEINMDTYKIKKIVTYVMNTGSS